MKVGAKLGIEKPAYTEEKQDQQFRASA